jgi:hypothetical protein
VTVAPHTTQYMLAISAFLHYFILLMSDFLLDNTALHCTALHCITLFNTPAIPILPFTSFSDLTFPFLSFLPLPSFSLL